MSNAERLQSGDLGRSLFVRFMVASHGREVSRRVFARIERRQRSLRYRLFASRAQKAADRHMLDALKEALG